MDTITHGVVGALIGKALPGERDSRWIALSATLGSVFPDADIFANEFYASDLAMIRIHRGVTHSLVLLPVFALVFGWVTARALRKPDRWMRYTLCYGAGIASHIFLDLVTAYGTMIWSPLSSRRVSWDITFIVDLTLTSIALIPQLLVWTYSDRSRARARGVITWSFFAVGAVAAALLTRPLGIYISPWTVAAVWILAAALVWFPSLDGRGYAWPRAAYCRAGLGALALYMAASASMHAAAIRRVSEYARASGIDAKQVAALPAPPSMLQWSGLIETGQGVYRSPIELGGSRKPDYSFFASDEKNRYILRAEALPDVQTYLRFARFPWKQVREDGGMHIVEFRDIQFLFPRRGRNSPFTYRVSFDVHGNIVAAGLMRR